MARPGASLSPRTPGVNLVGYLAGEFGLGTSARLMEEALLAGGVPTTIVTVPVPSSGRASPEHRPTDQNLRTTSLLAVNAAEVGNVSVRLDEILRRTRRIGMWYWEVETFPASFDSAFDFVDEVWAATDFVRDAIAVRAPVPVRTVTPPLPQRDGSAPDLPSRFAGIVTGRPWFFFAFDYLSTAERKNPAGLVAAFTRAFAPGEGPLLVIKTMGAAERPDDARRLREATAGRDDIVLVDEFLERGELRALMANCTAYVSLHRAEGLGLTMAEAMAWGRPVIATGYSGNLQFMTPENAVLVPYTLVPIPGSAEPYPAGTPWAEPDVDIAADRMRAVVEQPAWAARLGEQAAADIARRNAESSAADLLDALGSLESRRFLTVTRRTRRVRRRARKLFSGSRG